MDPADSGPPLSFEEEAFGNLLASYLNGTKIADKESARKSGNLTKRGAVFKTWKLRYFVLLAQEGLLLYFKEPTARVPVGGLVLYKSEIKIEDLGGVQQLTVLAPVWGDKLKNRVFQIKGDPDDLLAWEVALSSVKASIEVAPPKSPSFGLRSPPPFLPSPIAPHAVGRDGPAAASGLSVAAQRNLLDHEKYRDFHIDKIRKVMQMDDILLAVDWLSFKVRGDDVGFKIYQILLGQVSDSICKLGLSTREELGRLWVKPILRLIEGRTEDVDVVDGELVVSFLYEGANWSNIGKRLNERFDKPVKMD